MKGGYGRLNERYVANVRNQWRIQGPNPVDVFKKVIKKFLVIDEIFWQMQNCFGEISKKGHSKISSEIWPPFLKFWIR